MIELRALGPLVLRDANGEDLQLVLAQPKRVALLAYLAMARPRGFHRRDTLLALLWPEQDEQHARWALNQALRHLRTALGKEAVPSRGEGEVGIDPQALWCDAVEFEAAIERDDPARALELYRGDLLEGFHVSGCGEFERWLEEERVWRRRRAARAAATLARREEAGGEPVAAGHWARRALALAPDDEGAIRSLIELLGRLGDRAGAIQAYEEFARRLRVEYEAEPAPETQAMIAAVRTRRLATGSSPEPSQERTPDNAGRIGPETSVVAAPPATPIRRRRRSVFLALTMLVLFVVGSLIWALRPAPTALQRSTVPRSTLAILPFAYRGSPEFAYLGEGLVDLLSANLNGAGEIRTVTPHAVFAQFRRTGRDRLDPEQAGRVAARLGAGTYVLGNVVETAGRLRISARLHSGEQGPSPGQALVDGPSTQLFQLVDGLTAQLIAQQSGPPAKALSRLAALTTDSLAALKAYLEAERHFRAWRLDSSIPALERAIRIDSSFALAHYRMATAVAGIDGELRHGPAGDVPSASEALERALRHAHRLGHRDRRMIEAYAAHFHGRLEEAHRISSELVTRYPDDLEATLLLGGLIFGWSGVVGGSSLDAREDLLKRVLSIDPTNQDALYKLIALATRERRLDDLDSLTNLVLQIVPPPGWVYRGQRAIVFGDTLETARFITALRKSGDAIAQPIAGAVTFNTGNLVVGRRLWGLITEPSRSRGIRALAHKTLAQIELMGGRWRVAQHQLDTMAQLDPATALEHRVLFSLWPLQQVPRSELLALRGSLLRWKAVPGPSNETSLIAEHSPAHPYLRLYLLGLLSARLDDQAAALDYSAELERRAAASFAPAFVGVLSRAVRAEVGRTRGRPGEALAILDSAGFWTREDIRLTGGSPFYDREYEQFSRAALLDTLGRYGEALEAFRGIADLLFHSGAPAHLRIAHIYERQGEPHKAAAHYAKFAELWKNCDPQFRPLVEEARRRIEMRN